MTVDFKCAELAPLFAEAGVDSTAILLSLTAKECQSLIGEIEKKYLGRGITTLQVILLRNRLIPKLSDGHVTQGPMSTR